MTNGVASIFTPGEGFQSVTPSEFRARTNPLSSEAITRRSSGSGAGARQGGGDGGAVARKAAQLEAQRLAELERQRLAQEQASRRVEAQRLADQQQNIIRFQTKSTGGQPIRNVQLGRDVAEFQRRSFEEAKRKGRRLTQKEKVKIAGDVRTPQQEVIKTTPPKIVHGITEVSNVKTFKEKFFELPGVKQIFEFEQKQAKQPSRISSFIEGKAPTKIKVIDPSKKGFSLTQKFFEFSTRAEFYKPGEFERLSAEGKDPQTNTLGNIIVGSADIIFKGQLFAPFLSTGAVKKGGKVKQRTEQVQKTSGVRFDSPKAEDVVGKFERVFAKKGRVGLEKELIKTFKELKTEESRKGFAELTKVLLKKDLIRPPSVRVTPAPIVRTSFPSPPKIELIFDIRTINAPALTPSQLGSSLGAGSIFDKDAPPIQRTDEISLAKIINPPTSNFQQKTSVVALSSLLQQSGQKQKADTLTKQIQQQIPRQRLDTSQPQLQIQLPKLKTLQRTKQQQVVSFPRIPKITKPPKIPKIIPFKFPRASKPSKQSSGKFQVLGRRFGKFKIVGTARTERGAFALGKRFAGTTLGVTFKVPKSKISKLPGFRTKTTGKGTLFIEPRGKRLKKKGKEVQEIQIFKQAKKKKKKGGKKK